MATPKRDTRGTSRRVAPLASLRPWPQCEAPPKPKPKPVKERITQQMVEESLAEFERAREEAAYEEMLYIHQQIALGRKGGDPKSLWHPRDNPEAYTPAHPADWERNRRRRGLFPKASDVHSEWAGARYAIRHYRFASRKDLGEHFEQSPHWAEKLLQAMVEEEKRCHSDGIPGWELDMIFPNRTHTFSFSELTITCPYQHRSETTNTPTEGEKI